MSNKKLLLVYPPKIILNRPHDVRFVGDISLAMLYLAGAARPVCDDVRIFDMNLPRNSLSALDDLIKLEKPAVVGINCLFSALFPNVRKIASSIKAINAEIKIVTGGIHPTIFAREIIENCPEIDAVMIGEADLAFPKLLRYYWGEAEESCLDSVVLKVGERIAHYRKASYIENLDELPMPAYDLVDFNEYKQDTSGWYDPKGIGINPTVMNILMSRSCPNQCNFCAMRFVMGNKTRFRSVDSIMNEIKHLHENYGVNYFRISDDNPTIDKNRIKAFLNAVIDSKMNIYIAFRNFMVRTLDAEIIELIARVSPLMANLAVESGSDYIRNKVMRKNVSKEKIHEVLELCKQHKIMTSLFFLVGMPEETAETLNETLEFINNADFDGFMLSIVVPFPGTSLFEQAKRDGLFTDKLKNIDKMWTGDFFGESQKNAVEQLIYIKPYHLSVEELQDGYNHLSHALKRKCAAWLEHRKKTTKGLDD
jgi:radical SAM superfamily enzyme YgiQ (UPF0313 family)